MIQKIAVDFDDTITFVNAYPDVGVLRPKAVEVLKKLKEKYILILWTCREDKYLEDAVNLLKENGVEFDYINECPEKSRKVVADVYIDDRAFGGIVDWEIIEKTLL